MPIAVKDSSIVFFLSDAFHLLIKSDREAYSPLMLVLVCVGRVFQKLNKKA